MGGQTGFSMRLQNRANMTPAQFEKRRQRLHRRGQPDARHPNVFTTFSTGTPQLYVDVDRDKAQMLHVPLEDIFEALRVYLGSAYVNDFNMFGRTFRVTAQADASFRIEPENVARIRVRNDAAQMVPLGNLVNFRESPGPTACRATICSPTVEVNGAPARRQLRPGARHDGDLAKSSCPRASPTSGPTCRTRRRRSAAPAIYIFALSVIFVFLALAAQYESWSLPLAIILIVPMCLLSGAVRRLAARAGQQHPDADRLHRAHRPGGQERHPHRRVRAPAGGPGPRYGRRRRSRPAGCACGRS